MTTYTAKICIYLHLVFTGCIASSYFSFTLSLTYSSIHARNFSAYNSSYIINISLNCLIIPCLSNASYPVSIYTPVAKINCYTASFLDSKFCAHTGLKEYLCICTHWLKCFMIVQQPLICI